LSTTTQRKRKEQIKPPITESQRFCKDWRALASRLLKPAPELVGATQRGRARKHKERAVSVYAAISFGNRDMVNLGVERALAIPLPALATASSRHCRGLELRLFRQRRSAVRTAMRLARA
jgi:hypothetical protein